MYIHYAEEYSFPCKQRWFSFQSSVSFFIFLNSSILQYRTVLYLLESLLLEVDFFKTVSDSVCSEIPMLGFGNNTPTGRKGSL